MHIEKTCEIHPKQDNVFWNYPLCSLTGMICYNISFFIKNSNLSLDIIMRKVSTYETETLT